jgi:hypothetical protein
MNGPSTHGVVGTAIALMFAVTAWPVPGSMVHAAELNLRPIELQPEPLSRLRSDLQWMTEQKIRAIWIGNDLFEKYDDSEKTKGQVLADAGFNLVRISMSVNTDDKKSGVVDTSNPLEVKHDRSKSTALETRLAPNVAEARRVGLKLMIGLQYGTHHLEPYRKYRSSKDGLAKITCCPIEEQYITGQHVGKWAGKIAAGGADGMVIDMEMYHSDKSGYHGSCVCDNCFATYLKAYARNWQQTYDQTPAEGRAKWLADQRASDHYAAFAAQRIEALYDSIRSKCQKINPAFFFGIAPVLHHLPGVERGLGSTSTPCLVFSEHEYHHGAYRGSFIGTQHIRKNLPALFVSGAYVAVQTPAAMANNVVQSSLYTDGWWPWYGTALLTNTAAGAAPGIPYGRIEGTSARDYLDRITAAHAQLNKLLAAPRSQWPQRQDGKLNWLTARVVKARGAQAKAEAKADLEKYEKLVLAGGY